MDELRGRGARLVSAKAGQGGDNGEDSWGAISKRVGWETPKGPSVEATPCLGHPFTTGRRPHYPRTRGFKKDGRSILQRHNHPRDTSLVEWMPSRGMVSTSPTNVGGGLKRLC